MNTWETRTITSGTGVRWTIGPLHLHVFHQDQEWFIAHEYDTEGSTELSVQKLYEKSENLEWACWKVNSNTDSLSLKPVMPDRAIIVRPDTQYFIPSNGKGSIYISVPVWINVSVGSNNEDINLCELPTTILSDSWFGMPASGELCYALKVCASSEIQDEQIQENRAICRVFVSNDSEERLELQRLCVRVEHLRLYVGNRHLWTNSNRMSYRGEEREAKIEYEQVKPSEDDVGDLITEARIPVHKGIIKKSFNDLKFLTGF